MMPPELRKSMAYERFGGVEAVGAVADEPRTSRESRVARAAERVRCGRAAGLRSIESRAAPLRIDHGVRPMRVLSANLAP